MRARKTANGHYRAMLLKRFWEMKLSASTQSMISEHFKNYHESEKEQNAKEILKAIQDCKTEAEVIKEIETFIANKNIPLRAVAEYSEVFESFNKNNAIPLYPQP